jgi:hypothetical protein
VSFKNFALASAVALTFMAACSTPPVAANSRTVQDLYGECKAQSGLCLGYLLGTADQLEVNDSVARGFRGKATSDAEIYLLGARMCGSYTSDALAQAFVNWAEKHPRERAEDMAVGVLKALVEAFPCREK